MIFVRVPINMMCLEFNVGSPPSKLGGGFRIFLNLSSSGANKYTK